MRGLGLVAIAASVAACEADVRPGSDPGHPFGSARGAALYQDMCQVCHGEAGEGGLGPALVDTELSPARLEQIISTDMPANNPGQCSGDCASEITKFIVQGLTTEALKCDQVPPGPRRLRLLTRREYRATVRDLFGDRAPALACARASDCSFRDECTAGLCEASACDAHTFVFDPNGRSLSSVHIAGSFNGWAGTIGGGGLALAYSNTTGLWTGTFAIGEGLHQYKLVLNEGEWVTDPRAPTSAPDGFGGRNASLALSCAEPDVAARIPAESRPASFPFDSESSAAVVTTAHVEAYMSAAEPLAAYVTKHACPAGGVSCAQTLVAKLGRQLFRRPLSTEESTAYRALAASDLEGAVQALLVSPGFLYRSELGEPTGDTYRLTGYELATALSFGFLGTTPDDALLAAAEAGELDNDAGLERWARALLARRAARDQLGEMVLQWVGGQNIVSVDKRADLFPGFDDRVRRALANETRRFAADVVFDGSGSLDDLLTANYTVLDPIAAQFYGVPTPTAANGHASYAGGMRAGLLGHASLLATTAHSDQTSPIRRGLLVRRNLLCQELPPPPPFAGGVPDVDPTATTRERFAQHTDNPACASCHQYIDGIGFGLEHFDPVGRWRTTEAGAPIDAAGDLTDVEKLGSVTSAPFATVPELAAHIANSQAAASCFTRQYLRYTRGLRESLEQRCERLALERTFEASGRDIGELMVQSVLSPAFKERR